MELPKVGKRFQSLNRARAEDIRIPEALTFSAREAHDNFLSARPKTAGGGPLRVGTWLH